jgi:hypothetical protein
MGSDCGAGGYLLCLQTRHFLASGFGYRGGIGGTWDFSFFSFLGGVLALPYFCSLKKIVVLGFKCFRGFWLAAFGVK